MNVIENRVIELSYRHQLTHVSSCLNCVNLIDTIYELRQKHEPFILGNHASLAHYVVLEKYGYCDAEEMLKRHGVHSTRDLEHGIWCSGGSLGQPETIAVGMAMADLTRKVWLVTTDGACMEGATMEAFRVANHHCRNLRIHIVFNGWGAYGRVSSDDLPKNNENVQIHCVHPSQYPEFLRGLNGHYLKLSEDQYKELMSYEA